MRMLILGCGLMAPAAAFHAMSDSRVSVVTLSDVGKERLREARQGLAPLAGGEKLSTLLVDATDEAATARAMADFDVVIAALPQAASASAIRAAATARIPLVDLTCPPEEEMADLRSRLQATGGLAIVGCGVDPGLSEIMARHLAEKMDAVEEVHIRCGGVPEHPTPPLDYKIVFGGRQLPLRAADALVVDGGVLKPVPRYSGAEKIFFPGVGEMEAYHEGFPPRLLELPALVGLRTGTQKTVRWPGYAAKATLLKELGMLDQEPLAVGACAIPPKAFLDALLAPRLRLAAGERDLIVFRVEASGRSSGRLRRLRVDMVGRYDATTGFTAMARVTAFTAAIVARMVAGGEIRSKGLVTPEQVIAGAPLARLIAELATAGIRFDLSSEQTEPLTGEDAKEMRPCLKKS